MYTNIRGMKSKRNSLTETLHEHDPHLYLITETQLRSNVGMQIDGYTFYSRKREGKNGGGVGILVRNDVKNKTSPHISDRNLEIMWISLQRKARRPLMIGVYYGVQESRTNKEEIELEMSLLREEITEMQMEGEILITMDANAKIGLLGEEISRNGKLLLNVFQQTGLCVLNNTTICKGKITRKNTKKENEISAIDFVVVNQETAALVTEMLIDEEGMYKIKGRNETDHNTICVELSMNALEKERVVKKTDWNLRASSEKWTQFGDELEKRKDAAHQVISDTNLPFQERYFKWYGYLNSAAMTTIGKTTFKAGGKEKFSQEIKSLRDTKKELKQEIKSEKIHEKKQDLIHKFKDTQEKIATQIDKERGEIMKQKLERIASDKSRTLFWKEKKKTTRDPVLEALTIKDANGLRQFQPDAIKHHTALYYENLYKQKPLLPRTYHHEVDSMIPIYKEDREHEDLIYNTLPSKTEVSEVIKNKSNGKSTTDIKNEMLKRPGEKMIDFIYPLIETIWEEEQIPDTWNTGHITSLWKGKGDREKLENHRGITTSSAIGSIIETLIDHRIEAHVPFTQAQGGGQRGSSTCDHLFLLRAIIDISISEKRTTYLTFYDVSKAYDNANNSDMLKIIWDDGIRGKTWRILKNMNSNLKAKVKTKHGLTNDFEMEIGGRQGSRLTGRLFAKMMDKIAERALTTDIGFHISTHTKIPMLLWIDDVISIAESTNDQWSVLRDMDIFAKDHRLRWGQAKCQVMKIGKHKKDIRNDWKIGEMDISETKSYKYLGDVITDDGKNTKNIESRKNKSIATTISIKTIASNHSFKQIGAQVLIDLHETINMTAVLTNSESWTLRKKDKEEFEKLEIQAFKHLFDLPIHTPTPAIIYTFGLLYTTFRIEQRQLNYLWKIVQRDPENWTHIMLQEVLTKGIGWGKSIKEILERHSLPTDLQAIRNTCKNEWTMKVKKAIETANKERLLMDCHKIEQGVKKRKSKTSFIVDSIIDTTYQRAPLPEIMKCTKQEAKTLLIARYRMLECGNNFKGSQSQICRSCNLIDDEPHRLNYCIRLRECNYYDNDVKIEFKDAFSNDIHVLRDFMPKLMKLWNLRNANGTVNIE